MKVGTFNVENNKDVSNVENLGKYPNQGRRSGVVGVEKVFIAVIGGG